MVQLIPSPAGKWAPQTPVARIYAGFPYPIYVVENPSFSEEEKKLAELMAKALNRRVPETDWARQLPAGMSKSLPHAFHTQIITYAESHDLIEKPPSPTEYNEMVKELEALLKEYANTITQPKAFAEYVIDQGAGFWELGKMMRDPELNEIMVNGFGKYVFVEHQKMGMCQSNIFIEHHDPLINRIVLKSARFAGRNFSEEDPLLDARLPDGNRLNATYETITPLGHSITIRKFRNETYSLIDLINAHTISSELAAYLWIMAEGMGGSPMNMLISGGSGSGKTTLLNALAACVPYRERIISIEDTLELQFPERQNWIAMESKPSIGKHAGIGMDDLLKNALRMRPDRVIVGEVRGIEAQTLFAAMDTGHSGSMGTIHANSPSETLLRLTSEPMNVPKTLIPLLNIVLIMQKIHFPGEGTIRRVSQVAEISHMEREPLLANVYERKPDGDIILRTDTPSHSVQVLADATGKTRKIIQQEILVRQKILEWMTRHNIHAYAEVEQVFQRYLSNPLSILEQIQS